MRIHGEDRDIESVLDDTEGGPGDLDRSQALDILEALGARSDGRLEPELVQRVLRDGRSTMPELMLWLTRVASLYAYAPISGFMVGAVSLGDSGALYWGCNLEFPGEALSLCTHAEQSAIVNAKHHGETGVRGLAMSAAPCGHCRQFLYELRAGPALHISLATGPTTLGALLPEAFGPGELGNASRLLDGQDHRLSLDQPSEDPVVAAALAAANACYAPYTRGYAGVAVVGASGRTYAGGTAESVAYNPTVSPMEAALVPCNFAGERLADLTRAVLVESRPSGSSQLSATSAVLASLAPGVALEVHPATSAEEAGAAVGPSS